MKILLRLDQHDYDLLLTAIDLAAEHPDCSEELSEELAALGLLAIAASLSDRQVSLHKKSRNSADVAKL